MGVWNPASWQPPWAATTPSTAILDFPVKGPILTNGRPLQPLNPPDGQELHHWGPELEVKGCAFRDMIGRCVEMPPEPLHPRVLWKVIFENITKRPYKYLDSSPPWASGFKSMFKMSGSESLSFDTANWSASFQSSDSSGEDFSSADRSMRGGQSMGMGSSGSYMALWKIVFLFVLGVLCCLLCGLFCVQPDPEHGPALTCFSNAESSKSSRPLTRQSHTRPVGDDEEDSSR